MRGQVTRTRESRPNRPSGAMLCGDLPLSSFTTTSKRACSPDSRPPVLTVLPPACLIGASAMTGVLGAWLLLSGAVLVGSNRNVVTLLKIKKKHKTNLAFLCLCFFFILIFFL